MITCRKNAQCFGRPDNCRLDTAVSKWILGMQPKKLGIRNGYLEIEYLGNRVLEGLALRRVATLEFSQPF
ncbi:MAG TPA: hypothetical protein VI306_10525 [Pyrinomonadaceae bacterium]